VVTDPHSHKHTDRTDYNTLELLTSAQCNESGIKEENNEMPGLEFSNVCSRDVDIDADRQKKIRSLGIWIWRRMEKISWTDKVMRKFSGQ